MSQLPEYLPAPGSAEERAAFAALQPKLQAMFENVYPDLQAPRCVVVVPGLSLDRETLAKLTGAQHYEERQLSMLMWLRLPRARVIFLTSSPVADSVVDYYLGMLAGVPHSHARQRLTLLSCNDPSDENLTRKILRRPRLVQRIREAIKQPEVTHLTAFNTTPDEVTLSVQLGVPLYGCDPDLNHLGTKSGSRKIFKEAEVVHPDGVEELHSVDDAVEAILELRGRDPVLRRAVLKLEEGFSGEGNALLDLPPKTLTRDAVRDLLYRSLRPEAEGQSAESFLQTYTRMGGIVESWVEGERKTSPSVQMRVTPSRELEIISTHDQVLGGASGQVFLGSKFPAHSDYRTLLVDAARKVGHRLRDRGVLGRFAVDFVTTWNGDECKAVALEINLRKGGTTLPFQMLQFLTAGTLDTSTGAFLAPLGSSLCYYATDNLTKAAYRALTTEDLLDLLVRHRLHFDPTRQQGVVFHLMGALSMYGKLGLVSIAPTHEQAEAQYRRVEALLDEECAATPSAVLRR
ncbi:MAG: peptide ligase PGM1-related protein [Polyangiaceae bacterium]